MKINIIKDYAEYLAKRRRERRRTARSEKRKTAAIRSEELTLYRSLKGKPNQDFWSAFFDKVSLALKIKLWSQIRKKIGQDDSPRIYQVLKFDKEIPEKIKKKMIKLFIQHAGSIHLSSAILYLEEIAEIALSRLDYLYKKKRISELDYKYSLIQAMGSDLDVKVFDKLKLLSLTLEDIQMITSQSIGTPIRRECYDMKKSINVTLAGICQLIVKIEKTQSRRE